MHKTPLATLGPYSFFSTRSMGGDVLLYGFTISGERDGNELFTSLDQAMAGAIAARHMGYRGAGGFLRMIGHAAGN